MNNGIGQIFVLLFTGVPFLLLGLYIGATIESFSWADTQNQKLNKAFKCIYKKPISTKKFAVENEISLAKAKTFLDDKLHEFGGITLNKNDDIEYHIAISNALNEIIEKPLSF